MDYLTNPERKKLIVGGHRGHQSDVRENTIENFAQIVGKGVPYIEIDVQLTQDGELVIFHDQELSRTTDCAGTIRDYSLADLRASFRINTVKEVLDWAQSAPMGIAFELKLYPMYTLEERAKVASSLVSEIKEHDYYQDCFVFGKDYQTLKMIRTLDKNINIAIITPNDPDAVLPLMKELRAFMYLDWLKGFSKELVDKLHENGYLADGSVVDTIEGMKMAVDLGLDMIESNKPEEMIAFRDRYYSMN